MTIDREFSIGAISLLRDMPFHPANGQLYFMHSNKWLYPHHSLNVNTFGETGLCHRIYYSAEALCLV